MTRHLFQIPGTHIRVAFVFAWYDLYIGAYVKTPSRGDMREVYLMFLTVGLLFSGREPWQRALQEDLRQLHFRAIYKRLEDA